MPSTYTANIYEGRQETFESFMLKCARQFGANIRMRDDSLDAEIKEYKPCTRYYEQKLEQAKLELIRLESMSTEEIQKKIDESYEEALASYRRRLQDKLNMRSRYEAMINQVESWEPPTNEHVSLKQFALSQLNESLEFDCGYMPEEPVKSTVEEYLSSSKEHYQSDINYYQKLIEKEIDSVEKANEWNRLLKESLRSNGN